MLRARAVRFAYESALRMFVLQFVCVENKFSICVWFVISIFRNTAT
jgi:hypothetical protein